MSDANRDKFDSGRYDQLVDQVMDSLDGASEVTLEKLTSAVNETVELEQTAFEMSADEMALLKAYLLRDLKQFSIGIQRVGGALADWLELDFAVLEKGVVERLMRVADRTRIEQELLREQLSHDEVHYAAGEMALPGQFVCTQCGSKQTLSESQQLQSCRHCSAVLFERAISK
jgi:hypothetical protein